MHAWGLRALFDKPSFLVPSPPTVIDQSYLDAAVRGDMLRRSGWTAGVAVIGLAISIVLGDDARRADGPGHVDRALDVART